MGLTNYVVRLDAVLEKPCVRASRWSMKHSDWCTAKIAACSDATVAVLLLVTYSSIKSRFTASNRRHKDQSTSQLQVAPRRAHCSLQFTSCRKCCRHRSITRCGRTEGAETRRKAYSTTGWRCVGWTRAARLTWSATVGLNMTSLCLFDCTFVCLVSALLELVHSSGQC